MSKMHHNTIFNKLIIFWEEGTAPPQTPFPVESGHPSLHRTSLHPIDAANPAYATVVKAVNFSRAKTDARFASAAALLVADDSRVGLYMTVI